MIYIFSTFFLLAAGVTANKFILNYLSPLWFVALRTSLSSIILMGYTLYQLRSLPAKELGNPKRYYQDWPLLILMAICTTLFPSFLKAFGLKYMFAAKATLLNSLDPFITAIYSYLLWSERLSWSKILGIVVGIVGMMMAIVSQSNQEIGWETFYRLSYPELAIIASCMISRLGWMMAQKLLRSKRYLPSELNGIMMAISGAVALIMANSSHESITTIYQLPFSILILFIATIVLSNVIGYLMYAHCLQRYSATLISLAGFLVPILVALFAYLFLQETLNLSFFLASFVVFAGLIIFYIGRARSLEVNKNS
jgi:drug/metabolite transporter (DMT)-like permease